MLTDRKNAAAGFTMVELVVSLALFAVLVAATVPSLKTWIANNKVRAVADALQNGIRLAQSEALNRSRQVVFALTTSTSPQSDFTGGTLSASASGTSWVIVTIPAMVDGSESAVLVSSGVLTSAGTPVTITGPAEVCFNSLGRLVANPTTGLAGGSCTPATASNLTTIPNYTYGITLSGGHSMNVQLALGGQVHMCDPAQTLSSTNPYGC